MINKLLISFDFINLINPNKLTWQNGRKNALNMSEVKTPRNKNNP